MQSTKLPEIVIKLPRNSDSTMGDLFTITDVYAVGYRVVSIPIAQVVECPLRYFRGAPAFLGVHP